MTGRERGTPAESDPVRALLAARRDGLLEYRGYAEGDRYEVALAGVTRKLPAAEALAVVQRLRALAQLPGRVVEVTDDGTWGVEVAGRRWQLPARIVVDWADGYAAAQAGAGSEHQGVDQLDGIRKVLTAPSLADQLRMVLLGLKEGQARYVSTQELADQLQVTKKTVVQALAFGEGLAMARADELIAALGYRWVIGAEKVDVEPVDGGAGGGQLPRMPGLERLSLIVAASDQGWLRYVDEPSLNRARRARSFELAVGSTSYVVEAEALPAWLDGVSSFHEAERG